MNMAGGTQGKSCGREGTAVTTLLGNPTAARPARADRRRNRLPGGRATAGAALMVIAAAGVLVAHRSASAPPTSRYVVVAHDLDAGHVLGRADLGTLAADLPSGVRAVPAADADGLLGRVTRTSLSELDLIRPADVIESGRFTRPGSVEVPVAVDASRAPVGALRTGTRVDVLATDPEGDGTQVLATDVLVVGIADGGDGAIGDTSEVRVRLAVDGAETATDVVDAAVRAQLTLVLPTPREGGDD
jgi:hypothetical protein